MSSHASGVWNAECGVIDQPPLQPRLARAVGAQQFGHRLDRRLDGQHVQPGRRRDCPRVSTVASASRSTIGPRAVFTTTAPSRQQRQLARADHAARLRRQRRVHGTARRTARSSSSSVLRALDAERAVRRRSAGTDRRTRRGSRTPWPAAPPRCRCGRGRRCRSVCTLEPADQRVRRPPSTAPAACAAAVSWCRSDAAPERQRQRDRVVGHLHGAVVGHVAHHHAARGRGGAVDAVVADAHAHHARSRGNRAIVGGAHPVAQHHQAVDLGAVGGGRARRRFRRCARRCARRGRTPRAPRFVGVEVFGIENGRHGSLPTVPCLRGHGRSRSLVGW